MTEELVLTIGAEAIKTTMMLAAPLLLSAMAIGLLVSIFQAITQINEATLTFIPKMLAVVLVLVVLAPWMIEVLRNYAADVIGNAGNLVR